MGSSQKHVYNVDFGKMAARNNTFLQTSSGTTAMYDPKMDAVMESRESAPVFQKMGGRNRKIVGKGFTDSD